MYWKAYTVLNKLKKNTLILRLKSAAIIKSPQANIMHEMHNMTSKFKNPHFKFTSVTNEIIWRCMEKQINFLYFIALSNFIWRIKYVRNFRAVFDKKSKRTKFIRLTIEIFFNVTFFQTRLFPLIATVLKQRNKPHMWCRRNGNTISQELKKNLSDFY